MNAYAHQNYLLGVSTQPSSFLQTFLSLPILSPNKILELAEILS